jgi:hypothetical protein
MQSNQLYFLLIVFNKLCHRNINNFDDIIIDDIIKDSSVWR